MNLNSRREEKSKMENGRVEGYERILNKSITIFYQDGENSVGRKDGKLISVSIDSLTLLTSFGEIIIPKLKIVRVEVK